MSRRDGTMSSSQHRTAGPQQSVQQASGWQEVRSAAGRLLFKINPARRLIQVRMKGETTMIDLEEWIDCSRRDGTPSLPIQNQFRVEDTLAQSEQ